MSDEQQIRDLIITWHRATASGDLETILTLMDPDVVFLIPGVEPMRGRNTFATGFRKATEQFRIEPRSEVQEILICADLAYCWNYLHVTMVPLHGGMPNRRSGNTLTLLRKNSDGKWVVFRDANMLVPDKN